MSLGDLRKMGLLRPEPEWTQRVPRTSVPTIAALGCVIMAGGGCTLMVLGNGGPMTWVGLGVFILGLAVFTWLNLRSVRAEGLD